MNDINELLALAETLGLNLEETLTDVVKRQFFYKAYEIKNKMVLSINNKVVINSTIMNYYNKPIDETPFETIRRLIYANNFSIEDVYDDEEMINYICDKYDIVDICGESSLFEYVKRNYTPTDIYDYDELRESIEDDLSLDDFDEQTIKEYVQNNYDISDWVDWN